MTKDKFPLYALAIFVVAAGAMWAGLPPSLLLFLLVCPLMMFFMMFFMMRGGQERRDGETNHDEASLSRSNTPPAPAQSSRLDGSHERIDQS